MKLKLLKAIENFIIVTHQEVLNRHYICLESLAVEELNQPYKPPWSLN